MLTEKNWPPEAALQLLAMLFLCLGTGMLAGAGAMSLLERMELTAHRQSVSLVIGTISFHGGGLLAVAIFLRLTGQRFVEAFGILNGQQWRAVKLGLGAIFIVLPLAWLLSLIAAAGFGFFNIEAPPQTAVQIFKNTPSLGLKVYFACFAVLLAPVVEEILFRGIFYPAIKQLGRPRVALWGTAVVFAAIHLNLLTFFPLVMLAVVLTKLYESTGNLLAPVVCHAAFNALNFIALIAADRLEIPLPQ